jgi:UDP-N-acetylglucosamine--N-acetylmuramyl-(pentapeptide) pyrophosphoryl-undecaprenol N-acetylglucosamine transferase
MRLLLAGGGTGGHVNPLLALAELLRADGHEIIALGTKEGLEKTLVPERGFRLETVARLPLPRKFSPMALLFPFRLFAASLRVALLIRREKISGVVGFGGFASAPAYIAAFLTRTPLVIHEANSIAGFANRLGSKLTKFVAVCFPNTNLAGAAIVGMPLRQEFAKIVAGYDQGQARVELGLDPSSPTLLVTGGSQGAWSINQAIEASRKQLTQAGIQVIHIVGGSSELPEEMSPGFLRMRYCSSMEAAIAASDLAVSRAGSSTIGEFTACGLPAIYVPYPVGNGEQRHNAQTVVEAGGGVLVEDSDFTASFVTEQVLPMISHRPTLREMSMAAKSVGLTNSAEQLRDLVLQAVNT